MVFADGRWLDLKLVADAGEVPGDGLWVDGSLSSVDLPDGAAGAPTLPQLHAEVAQVRFLGAYALAKAARDDQLIGAHLLLEAAREVLVRGMQLRDRDLGTTIHRHGGPRNQVWREVQQGLGQPLPEAVVAVVGQHEQLAAELWDDHRVDLSGLNGLARRLQG